tara:strand:+ start:90 stop:236 length:147 start_codon:yes stop_codon:yes gene_type:complete
MLDALVIAGYIEAGYVAMAALLPRDAAQRAFDTAVALEVDTGSIQRPA